MMSNTASLACRVVFEVWSKNDGKNYLRVLWGGQPLQSSAPQLGKIDMIDLQAFFDVSPRGASLRVRRRSQLMRVSPTAPAVHRRIRAQRPCRRLRTDRVRHVSSELSFPG